MTLTRRMAIFVASMLLLALSGALVIHTLAARDVLHKQQDVRNRDAAAGLALALSQQEDPASMQAVATAQFDLGHYRSIRLTSPDGKALFDLVQPTPAARTPQWFAQLLPMDVAPGSALVSKGWREVGQLAVAAHTAWALEALWAASVHSAGLLGALALMASMLSVLLLRAWHRPLKATVRQAQALARGQFVEARLPKLPELQELTRSMNTTVRRLRETFAGQAEQVAYLQRQAQLDSLTGLPLRQQFIEHIERRLAQRDGLGLLLVRVAPLEQINDRFGREAADNVLRQAGAVVARFARTEPDSFTGRLAGPDLALVLPMPGMAPDLAQGMVKALYEAVAPLKLGARFSVAACPGVNATSAEAALLLATPCLALAELAGGIYLGQAGPAGAAVSDLAAWKSQIANALAARRAQIAEYPVVDPSGVLIHLECPLRLQLDPDANYQPASKWLPLARRSGLSPQVDMTAMALALAAIAQDGRPRAVNVELASLNSVGFVNDISALLSASPKAAAALWVEWVETADRGDWHAAADASQQWRKYGVQIGVEHAGSAPEQLARLRDAGLDYVKVDARHLRGVAQDPRVRAYAKSLAGLIRLLGLKVLAEGVDNPEDLAMLWQLGFEGATGPALRSFGTPPAQSTKAPARDAKASEPLAAV